MNREQQVRALGVAEGQLLIAIETLASARERTGGFLTNADHGQLSALIASSIATTRTALRTVRNRLAEYDAVVVEESR